MHTLHNPEFSHELIDNITCNITLQNIWKFKFVNAFLSSVLKEFTNWEYTNRNWNEKDDRS